MSDLNTPQTTIAETTAHLPQNKRTKLKLGLVIIVALLCVTALYKVAELLPPNLG